MNSGWQTKSQVKNTECRSKPSQSWLIHRKTGCTAPKPSLLQASNTACFAVGCIRPECEHGKNFSLSGVKHFKHILYGLTIFFTCLTPHLLMYTRHFWQVKHPTPIMPTTEVMVYPSAPRAPPKGSPSTEGCCRGNLRGQHQQTLPWLHLCEMQARPQSGCMNVASLVSTKAPRAFRCNASVSAHTPHLHRHTECNTCQGCILGSHACHLIRSPFNSILSFIWWNASRGPNNLHVTNKVYSPYCNCFDKCKQIIPSKAHGKKPFNQYFFFSPSTGELRIRYFYRKLKEKNKISTHYYGECISKYGAILVPGLST